MLYDLIGGIWWEYERLNQGEKKVYVGEDGGGIISWEAHNTHMSTLVIFRYIVDSISSSGRWREGDKRAIVGGNERARKIMSCCSPALDRFTSH